MNLKPNNCPVCNSPMRGAVLVCSECWFKAPERDRAEFRQLYYMKRGSPDSKAQKIIRNLKAAVSSK